MPFGNGTGGGLTRKDKHGVRKAASGEVVEPRLGREFFSVKMLKFIGAG
jgi:hypothetical protein